jgi:hypothetical protein
MIRERNNHVPWTELVETFQLLMQVIENADGGDKFCCTSIMPVSNRPVHGDDVPIVFDAVVLKKLDLDAQNVFVAGHAVDFGQRGLFQILLAHRKLRQLMSSTIYPLRWYGRPSKSVCALPHSSLKIFAGSTQREDRSVCQRPDAGALPRQESGGAA